jgi:site-specific DNA recombinase
MDNTDVKQFLAYYRVSSKRQKDEGVSLEAQRKLIREYAKRNNLYILKEFEVDESAKKEDRRIFQELIATIKANDHIAGIIAEKVDRLLRGNLKDRVIIEDLINLNNKEIHFVKESLILSKDTKSAQKLHFDIQNALARHFLNNLSDEVKKGYDILVNDGFYPHIPPIGYESKLNEHVPVIDAERAKFVTRAFEYCASGEYSERQISDKLFEEGFRSRSGTRVGKSAMSKILHNPFYYGEFIWHGKLYKGNYEPIINKDLFDKVLEVLHPHKRKGYKYDFAYVGLMRCGECGNGITAELQKGHTYYHCTKPKGAKFCSQKYVREEVIEKQLQAVIQAVSLDIKKIKTIREIMRVSLEEETQYLQESLDALNGRYNDLQGQSSRLLDLYLKGSLAEVLYNERSAKLNQEIEGVNGEIIKHKKADRAYQQEIESFLVFCSEAPKLYAGSRPALKRELLRFVVSNLSLKDGKVDYTLQIPFNVVAQYAQSENWQGHVESNHDQRFWRPLFYH